MGPTSTDIEFFANRLFEGNQTSIVEAVNTDFYDSVESMVQTMSLTPHSIAAISLSTYQKLLQIYRKIPINGISPSLETIEKGSYPFEQILYIYADQDQLKGEHRTGELINFYLTHAHDLMPEVGLLPLKASQLNQSKTEWMRLMGVKDSSRQSSL